MNGLSNPTKIFARRIYLLAKVDDDRIKELKAKNARLERQVKRWIDNYNNRYDIAPATKWDIRFHKTTRLARLVKETVLVWTTVVFTIPLWLPWVYFMTLFYVQIEDFPLSEYNNIVQQPLCNAIEWINEEGPNYGLEVLHWFYTIYAYWMYFLYHLLEIKC